MTLDMVQEAAYNFMIAQGNSRSQAHHYFPTAANGLHRKTNSSDQQHEFESRTLTKIYGNLNNPGAKDAKTLNMNQSFQHPPSQKTNANGLISTLNKFPKRKRQASNGSQLSASNTIEAAPGSKNTVQI